MPHGNPVSQFLGILILTTHKVNSKGPRRSTHSQPIVTPSSRQWEQEYTTAS